MNIEDDGSCREALGGLNVNDTSTKSQTLPYDLLQCPNIVQGNLTCKRGPQVDEIEQ